MIKLTRNIMRKAGERIEEIILACIIILNIFDFFEILPGELDYIKKIISWTALGYLLYDASLTKIFFGVKHRKADLLLILTYFMLILKNFITYALAAREETEHLAFFYTFIISYAHIIERYSLYIGGAALIILSAYVAYRFNIFSPSLMHVIHEEGPRPRTFGKFLIRFMMVFLVFIGFFTIVFNLMMEWLAIAVDAPLLMLAILFYIFKAKDFGPETFLYKLGTVGEGFYERFIQLFHSKKRIFLGISGMLVLHLLTDIGNFIVPHVTGLHDVLYFAQFDPKTHTPILSHMISDLDLAGSMAHVSQILYLYVTNVFAMLFLLITPSFLWYVLFYEKKININDAILGIFGAAIISFFMAPIFRITSIGSESIVGVDIQTQSALVTSYPAATITLISLAVGILVYAFTHIKFVKNIYIVTSISVCMLFMGYYIYNFFTDITSYYLNNIIVLLQSSEIFLGVFLFFMFMITIVFYIGGFGLFIVEVIKS